MLNERVEALEMENKELGTQLAKAKVEQALGQEEKMIMKRELGIVKKQSRSRQSGGSLQSSYVTSHLSSGL